MPATAAIAGAKSRRSVYSAYPAPEARPAANDHAVFSATRSRQPGLRKGGRGGGRPKRDPGGRAGGEDAEIVTSSVVDVADVAAFGRENTPIARDPPSARDLMMKPAKVPILEIARDRSEASWPANAF